MTFRERETDKLIRQLLDAADLAEQTGFAKLAGKLRSEAEELCEEFLRQQVA